MKLKSARGNCLPYVLAQGFPNWGICTPRGTFRLLKGTLLCERISLFKLNSLCGRNNRLKCLEFSNPVDCNYVKQDNKEGRLFYRSP